MSWMGIGHEVGHHVYRQLTGFRDELEHAIQIALQAHPPAQQRLWLAFAEETFADCYAILTLGKAFLYTHHPVFLYAGSADTAKNAAQEDDYIKQTLLQGGDESHPTPELRSRMGIYAYEKLIDPDPLPRQLADWVADVLDTFNDPYDDVLSPGGESQGQVQGDIFNPDPNKKLPRHETHAAMRVVVDTILTRAFVSLGNASLQHLVNFANEERTREAGPAGNAQDRMNIAAAVLAIVGP
jgi:hypothetical protein